MPAPNDPASLSQRFDEYARMAEGIVLRGIEHPSCELKRSLTLDREELGDRLDFIKLVQGLANSSTDSECLIIIGADQKAKRFVHVENADDFDAARVSPILAKYLSPEPRYEIFNSMKAPSGERYVLIVLGPHQHRPIMTVTDGESQGKVRFRLGDIWIKENTRLRPANHVDLNRMYQSAIEQEAAKRARIIFEHMKAELGPQLLSQAVESTPTPELLRGSRERLARFAQAMISSGDPGRFKMLLEMARQILVEKWDGMLKSGSRSPYGITDPEKENVGMFYKNDFLPALTALIDLGIELIRFDAQTAWLGLIATLLIEVFEVSCEFDHLAAINQAGDVSVPFARPAYEAYLGARVLATYAAYRNRWHFLRELLPRYVWILAPRRSEEVRSPLLFWPFRGELNLPDMKAGRNQTFWEQRIEETWSQAFGSEDQFLYAAAQLEFILELNSFLLVQYRSPQTDQFRLSFPEKRTEYVPDFWNTPLRTTMSVAQQILDQVVDKGIPADIAIEPAVTSAVLTSMSKEAREIFYGEFLTQLRSWQDQTMMQQMRFPFLLEWPPRLRAVVDRYKGLQQNQKPRG